MLFSKRAPPHKVAFCFVVAIGNHASSLLTDGRAVFVDFDGIRNRFRTSTFAVEINEGDDVPVFEQCVGGEVVHGRIKAHVFNGESGHMLLQFMEGNQSIHGIVAFGTGKAKKQWKVSMQFTIVTGELEQCIAVIVLVEVTVPTLGSIRVRKMP